MQADTFDTSLEHALALDRLDPLARFRGEFEIPRHGDSSAVYLCGHSLGLMPVAARTAVGRELDAWARNAVGAHFGPDGGWYAYHERFAPPLAALLGVDPAGVVTMNSLTVNLHLMLVSFFRPAGKRRQILIESGAFPSDRYAVRSHLSWHGLNPDTDLVELAPAGDTGTFEPDDLDRALAARGGDVALVLLPGVQFLSGQALDLAGFAATARRHGAVAGFDLAHAIGNIARPLAGSDADFAIWCSYKYLNGGPGAIGGCYVHERWHDADLPRLEGWWGHDKQRRFMLEDRFLKIGTAESWQLSNPPIFAMAPLAASLAIFEAAGIERLREKSMLQTDYLTGLLTALAGDRVEILTPTAAARGCQISVRVRLGESASATPVVGRLAADGIVADWRAPDVLRLAPTPLYNSFEDIHRAAHAVARILIR